MKRFLLVVGVSVLLSVVWGGCHWLAQAANTNGPTSTCTGTVTGGVLRATTVPPGATCVLDHVIVQGTMTANGAASVTVKNGSIVSGLATYTGNGSVTLTDSTFVTVTCTGNGALVFAGNTVHPAANHCDS